jgi:hypothetical protein
VYTGFGSFNFEPPNSARGRGRKLSLRGLRKCGGCHPCFESLGRHRTLRPHSSFRTPNNFIYQIKYLPRPPSNTPDAAAKLISSVHRGTTRRCRSTEQAIKQAHYSNCKAYEVALNFHDDVGKESSSKTVGCGEYLRLAEKSNKLLLLNRWKKN